MASEPPTELVDVVDDDDHVIATVTRAEMRAGRLQHRAVSIAVLGTDGRLLVHRRADTKDVWPGMWDIAAGGVVAAGEDYDTAARRELAEELGIEAHMLVHLGTDGRLLVHRRADTKDVWPGMWDIAAGGVVAAGEDYDTAARRELAEELGVAAHVLVHLGTGRFADAAVALIGRGYLTVHDGPFTFTDGEIAEVRWVDRAALEALMADEAFVPDNVTLLLPLLDLP